MPNIEIVENETENDTAIPSKKKKIVIITTLIVIITIGSALTGVFVLKPYLSYTDAIKYTESGEYDKAIAIFNELEDYKDCKELKIDCIYQKAMAAIEIEDFRTARTLLDSITDNAKEEYKESKALYDKCDQLEKEEKLKIKYEDAKKLYNDQMYSEAAKAFNELQSEKYKDSKELFNESVYNYYVAYVKGVEKKINNEEEIEVDESYMGHWVNMLIQDSYKDINDWAQKMNDLIESLSKVEAKLIINNDGSKEEKGSKYNAGILELAMIAKITKCPKGSNSEILFSIDYSGPTLMLNGNHVDYLSESVDGYAYAYIYTPYEGTYNIKIYDGSELLDSRTVTVVNAE